MWAVVLLLLAQFPVPGVPASSGAVGVVNPSITFTIPTADSVYESSAVAQALGGSISAGGSAITGATIVCTGATSVSSTSVAGAAATSWTRLQTFSTGTTACTVTATDAGGRTAIASKTFIITNPDGGAPTVGAGVDASTSASSFLRAVSCTDDVGCVSVTWSNALGGTGTCDPGGNGTTTNWDCTFTLVATGGLTTANTITVTGTDAAGNSANDVVVVTRTVALSATTASMGTCTEGTAYSLTLAAAGGTPPYTWTKVSGTYPTPASPAFALTGATGVLAGTPSSGSAATYSGFVFRVTDNAAATADTSSMSLTCVAAGTSSYFATIAGLTESLAITGCVGNGDAKGCSLQNAAQISAVKQGTPESYAYDATENAAKLTWSQADKNIDNGLRIPINQASGTLLFVWDFKPSPTWATTTCGGYVDPLKAESYDHKEFNILMSPLGSSNDSISVETKTSFTHGTPSVTYAPTCADVGVFGNRIYMNSPLSNLALGYTSDTINPTQAGTGAKANTAGDGTALALTQPLKHGVWTRYWLELRLNQAHTAFTNWNTYYSVTVPSGKYHMYSLWVWDETMANPVRLVYKAPIQRSVSGQTKTATSVTCSGTTASLASTSNAGAGELIWVAGAAQSEYNGEFTVIDNVGGVIRYTISSCVTSPATGTITVSTVRDGVGRFSFEHNTSNNHIAAEGQVTISGTASTVVPNNTTLTRTSNGCTYKTQAAVTLNGSGVGTVAVKASPVASMGGPDCNADTGTALTTTVSGVTSVVVDAPGLRGGQYLLNGDLISWSRWFNVLKNYTLTDGSSASDDVTQNPTIFQKPR